MKLLRLMANLIVADDDLIEINAGSKIIVAERSTLTQILESRMERPCSVDAGIRS